jgi:hypothetical protein
MKRKQQRHHKSKGLQRHNRGFSVTLSRGEDYKVAMFDGWRPPSARTKKGE